MDANAASNASVSATSTTAPWPVAAPRSSRAAMPPLPKQLRRHHAFGVARPTQDAHQAERDHQQHEARGGEQELSHERVTRRDSDMPLPHDERPGDESFLGRRVARRLVARRRGSGTRVASASSPQGTVPGMRLVIVANVLRATPGGKSSGQSRSRGCSGRRGSSARRATSIPASTDCQRKCGMSAKSSAESQASGRGGKEAQADPGRGDGGDRA